MLVAKQMAYTYDLEVWLGSQFENKNAKKKCPLSTGPVASSRVCDRWQIWNVNAVLLVHACEEDGHVGRDLERQLLDHLQYQELSCSQHDKSGSALL